MTEDQFQSLKSMIEAMSARMEARFEQVDRRFEQVDKRFEHVDERLAGIDKDLMRIDAVLATKPDTGAIYAVAFTMMVGTVGMVFGAVLVANALGWLN